MRRPPRRRRLKPPDEDHAATPRLPLVRQLSRPLTRLLLRAPVSANVLTLTGLAAGLGCALMLAAGSRAGDLAAAGLLLASYVLDNCDGEVARARGAVSALGARLDDLADWLVNAAFFVGLGVGTSRATGEPGWLWLGLVAAGGATLNTVLVAWLRRREAAPEAAADGAVGGDARPRPRGLLEWLVYALRELARADFCFVVLVLAALDALWLLLPAAAVGAQLYWLGALSRRARGFRV